MSAELKNKIVVVTAMVFFFGISMICIIKPSNVFSDSERRYLEQFPEASTDTILSGKFMQKFEDYALDQFPFREKFRNIKAVSASYIFNKSDNNEIYIADGYMSQLEYPLKKDSVIRAAERFEYIYNKYMKESGTKIYVSIIPDKNYFMAKNNGYPSMDYSRLTKTLLENMSFADYIDITNLLTLEDYYKTDTHWKQECITDVADRLLNNMGVKAYTQYTQNILDKDFYGVYYGQAALPVFAEKIKYLTSSDFMECNVYDFENDREIQIYDFEKGYGKDSYELFLSGSLSLISIENQNADSEKELILFRDSFGSSLAPLLVKGYRKITLVDIRYIHPNMLGNFIEFKNQDVLFLYSTLVLNNAETIK